MADTSYTMLKCTFFPVLHVCLLLLLSLTLLPTSGSNSIPQIILHLQTVSLSSARDSKGYVTSATPCLVATIHEGNITISNSAYSHAVCQHQFLYLALLCSYDVDACIIMSFSDTCPSLEKALTSLL